MRGIRCNHVYESVCKQQWLLVMLQQWVRITVGNAIYEGDERIARPVEKRNRDNNVTGYLVFIILWEHSTIYQRCNEVVRQHEKFNYGQFYWNFPKFSQSFNSCKFEKFWHFETKNFCHFLEFIMNPWKIMIFNVYRKISLLFCP